MTTKNYLAVHRTMLKKRRSDYRIRLTRVIKAISSLERFTEFYKSLSKRCKTVKVLFTKKLNSIKVQFEIAVTY